MRSFCYSYQFLAIFYNFLDWKWKKLMCIFIMWKQLGTSILSIWMIVREVRFHLTFTLMRSLCYSYQSLANIQFSPLVFNVFFFFILLVCNLMWWWCAYLFVSVQSCDEEGSCEFAGEIGDGQEELESESWWIWKKSTMLLCVCWTRLCALCKLLQLPPPPMVIVYSLVFDAEFV